MSDRELTANAVIRVDRDGVSHWAYLMVSTNGPDAPWPIGYSMRCMTDRNAMLLSLISAQAAEATRVTCLLCLASEG